MSILIILILVAIAAFCEGVSDKWRKRYELSAEGGKLPTRGWEGFFPNNGARGLFRDAWHAIKIPMWGSYMAAIIVATSTPFSWWLCSIPIIRFVIFELALIDKKKDNILDDIGGIFKAFYK